MAKNILQFIKFAIIGASNTLVSLFVYYIFVFINKDLYIAGNFAGFVVSVLNSYYWNNRYVFKDSAQSHVKGILKAYCAYGGSFIVNTLLLFVFVKFLNINEFIAPYLNIVILTPINFLVNKLWIFKKSDIKSHKRKE